MNNKEWNYATRHTEFTVHQGSNSCLTHSMLPLTSHLWLPEPPSLPLDLSSSVMAIPQHCSPIHSTARFKHSPTTIPYPFALSPTESTPCPPIFCPHLKHFYAFLSQDPRMRSTNAALDQTSSNAKSHLESLLNRFRGPTMKFSFTKSELRSPEFVFLTNFQKVLTLQVVTAHN